MDRITEPDETMTGFGEKVRKALLASSSPNRRLLLEKCGITVIPFTPDADETLSGLTTEEAMMRNAERKMLAYTSSPYFDPSLYAFSADTLVSFSGTLIGKPRDREDAWRMLSSFSGMSQTVWTGCAFHLPGEKRIYVFSDRAEVRFCKLSERKIEKYLDSGEWMGAAGAYRLQKTGYTLIEEIDGDWTTVVGLPLKRLLEYLSPEARRNAQGPAEVSL